MSVSAELLIDELASIHGLDPAVVEQSRLDADSQKKTVVQVLMERKLIDESSIVLAQARRAHHPPMELRNFKVDSGLLESIPPEVLNRHGVLPIAKIGRCLTVAMADPTDVVALDDLRSHTQLHITTVLASEKELRAMLDESLSGGNSKLAEVMQDADDTQVMFTSDTSGEVNLEEMADLAEGAPVIRIVNSILSESLRKHASDIHIEPMEKNVRLRYRIDGNLYENPSPPKALMPAITSRIKIMSHLDIAERRVPQDGRFKIRAMEKDVDVRVSILPTVHGEKIVMRLLDKGALPPGVGALGLEKLDYDRLMLALRQPYGMIFVTGPTGSGKTTTLYSALRELNTEDVNIITVEDPVEYQLKGVNQVQVNAAVGLTFASGLRSILRQDPDIVLVGEVRDLETATICIQAALTGHLVLSTLHTNDAVGAIMRLKNMGIEPFMASSALILCQAQRLFRKLCPSCKVPVEVPVEVMKANRIDPGRFDMTKSTFFKAHGCSKCHDIGYKGRSVIMEILEVDEDIRGMIARGSPNTEIRDTAVRKGMTSLRDAGIKRAMRGDTSIEEILQVTSTL
jgi:type IV pilus assembly protein PilB